MSWTIVMSSMTNERRSLSFFYLLLINGFSLLWETTRVVWFLVSVLFGKKNEREVLPLHDTWKHINLSSLSFTMCVCSSISLTLLTLQLSTWNVCILGVLDTVSFPFLSLTLFHHPSHLYNAFSLSLDVTRVRPIHRERERTLVCPSKRTRVPSMSEPCALSHFIPCSIHVLLFLHFFPSSSSFPFSFCFFCTAHMQLLTSIIDFSSSSSLSQAQDWAYNILNILKRQLVVLSPFSFIDTHSLTTASNILLHANWKRNTAGKKSLIICG